jgi:hypothetical protein
MEIGDIINDAVRYPSSDWSKVFILGVIFIASFLIIPIFLAFGYLFRIIKATFAGIDELPDFDDLGDMFIDGLKVFIVGVVYAIPLILISLIISVIFGISHNTAINLGTFTGFNVFALATAYIIYLIVAIIIGLVEYMAIANMALYDGDLGAAFKFNEIMDRIARIGWSKYNMVRCYDIIGIGHWFNISFNACDICRYHSSAFDNYAFLQHVRCKITFIVICIQRGNTENFN